MSRRSDKNASLKRKRRQDAARRAARSAYLWHSTETYWHGGRPGLGEGTVLLPGGGGLLAAQSARGSSDGGYFASEKVYFTTDELLARAYAQTLRVGGGPGTLYRVEPIGPVERDPDYRAPCPAISFMADRARIVKVVEENVTSLSAEQVGEAFGRFQFWPGPEPYCAPDGTVRPSPSLRDEGWTYEVFALLPRWTPLKDLWTRLSDLVVQSPEKVIALAPAIMNQENRFLLAGYLSPEAIRYLKEAAEPMPEAAPPSEEPSLWRRLLGLGGGKS